MSSYVIEGPENLIKVDGSLKDDRKVIVQFNDEVFTFHLQKGNFSEGATSAELHCNDGSHVEEGAVTQDIKLPNGVKIESGAVTNRFILPNGRQVSDRDNNSGINITVDSDGSTKSSNIHISLSSSSGNKTIETKTRSQTNEQSNMNRVSKDKFVDAVTPGFGSLFLVLLGLYTGSASTVMIGSFLYLLFSLPTIIRYVAQEKVGTQEETERNSDSEDIEDKIEDVKEMYANGEISEQELEDKIENELEEGEDLELEYA